MSTQFKIGKTYETTVRNFFPACGLVDIGQQFTCHYVAVSGDAWSTDVKFNGSFPLDSTGWCVATAEDLALGYVREVVA